jgi:A/G-specific adenine glycosylase
LIEGTGENEGKILIRQRPDTGLLARMWELPHYEAADDLGMERDVMPTDTRHELQMERLRARWFREAGFDIVPQGWFMEAEHTFSHIHWTMQVFLCREDRLGADDRDNEAVYRWIDAAEVSQFAFPNVFLRILQQYNESLEKGEISNENRSVG